MLARYAEKNLFSELDEVSTKDGSSLEVVGIQSRVQHHRSMQYHPIVTKYH